MPSKKELAKRLKVKPVVKPDAERIAPDPKTKEQELQLLSLQQDKAIRKLEFEIAELEAEKAGLLTPKRIADHEKAVADLESREVAMGELLQKYEDGMAEVERCRERASEGLAELETVEDIFGRVDAIVGWMTESVRLINSTAKKRMVELPPFPMDQDDFFIEWERWSDEAGKRRAILAGRPVLFTNGLKEEAIDEDLFGETETG